MDKIEKIENLITQKDNGISTPGSFSLDTDARLSMFLICMRTKTLFLFP